MTIRKMEKRDYGAYCALLREVHFMHAENRPDIFKDQPYFPDEDEFAQMTGDPQLIYLAAEENGEVVGMGVMGIRMPKAAHVHLRAFAYIDDLCVKSGFRGRGIGTKLYEAMKEEARKRGLARAELMVWAFNEDAKRFYEKLGMKVRSYTMEDEL